MNVEVTEVKTTLEISDADDTSVEPGEPFPTTVVESETSAIVEIQEEASPILEISNPAPVAVEVTEEVVSIVTEQVQGPAGPPGPGTVTNDVTYTAGADLSGHRGVKLSGGQAVYISSADAADAFEFLGVTTGAAMNGAVATIRTYGVLNEPTWAWDVTKPIFLGIDGALTQVTPAAGFILVIAKALLPTQIFIDPKMPIVL